MGVRGRSIPVAACVAMLAAFTGLPAVTRPARASTPAEVCALGKGFYGTDFHGDPHDESIPTGWSTFLRPDGVLTVRVLLVDFPDAQSWTQTPEEAFAGAAAAGGWFETSSYGRLSLDFVGGGKWYRMPLSHAEYADDPDFESDAVAVADAEVDFTGTDILAIVTPPGTYVGGWASSYGSARADGHRMRHVVSLPGSGLLLTVHEIGHLFGLPDLYQTGGFRRPDGRNPSGVWDIMGSGWRAGRGELFAWHKWKLEWLTSDQIACHVVEAGKVEQTLEPVAAPGGVKALVVPISGYRAYVVENRQALGTDAGICEEGALVYEVNTHLGTSEGAITVQTNVPDDERLGECGQWWNAAMAPGESFVDAAEGVRIEIVGAEGDAVTVRVSRALPGARTRVTMEGLHPRTAVRGRVSSPDDPACVNRARVRVVRRFRDSFDEPPRYVTVARTIADYAGRYRMRFPAPEEPAAYIVAVRARTVDGIECFDAIAPRFIGWP